jgi:hypothetical protein
MSRLQMSILLGAAVIWAVAVPASAADRYKGFERAEALAHLLLPVWRAQYHRALRALS